MMSYVYFFLGHIWVIADSGTVDMTTILFFRKLPG